MRSPIAWVQFGPTCQHVGGVHVLSKCSETVWASWTKADRGLVAPLTYALGVVMALSHSVHFRVSSTLSESWYSSQAVHVHPVFWVMIIALFESL